ncbi:MAG: 16S rRNA (cytosine(1402)-N(4))-methyltransferase RsmH [Pseudoclavibacter sp.]
MSSDETYPHLRDDADPSALHVSVMRDRCVDLLAPALSAPGSVYVDATTGMGGHTEAVLDRCEHAQAICIDRDENAIALAGRRLQRFGDRVRFVHTSYDHIDQALDQCGVEVAQAVLFDLGVSSLQLDDLERGFSYRADAPLDMRMDPSQTLTAADVVNTYEVSRLWTIMRRYGEEKHARRIAERIGEMRAQHPLSTTADLVEAVRTATQATDHRGHPAKRVFQAIRIEVNQELRGLEDALPKALDRISVDGRVVVMSFQSLEDRIVKRIMRDATTSNTPSGLPVELEEHAPRFVSLTRGAEQAADQEQQQNPRARSVRLRAVQRVRRGR